MDVKGQVSVELLLLMLVILIILGSVTIPLIGQAIDSSMAVSDTSDVSAAVNSIVNAIGTVYANGPGSQRTLNVYFPASATLSYSNNAIQMPVNYGNGTPVKVGGIQKIISSSVPYNNFNFIPNGNVNEGNYQIKIAWQTSKSTIDITLTKT